MKLNRLLSGWLLAVNFVLNDAIMSSISSNREIRIAFFVVFVGNEVLFDSIKHALGG